MGAEEGHGVLLGRGVQWGAKEGGWGGSRGWEDGSGPEEVAGGEGGSERVSSDKIRVNPQNA